VSHDQVGSVGVGYNQNRDCEWPEVEVEHVVFGERSRHAQYYIVEEEIRGELIEVLLDDEKMAEKQIQWWHWLLKSVTPFHHVWDASQPYAVLEAG
jgi:hypothetical protein